MTARCVWRLEITNNKYCILMSNSFLWGEGFLRWNQLSMTESLPLSFYETCVPLWSSCTTSRPCSVFFKWKIKTEGIAARGHWNIFSLLILLLCSAVSSTRSIQVKWSRTDEALQVSLRKYSWAHPTFFFFSFEGHYLLRLICISTLSLISTFWTSYQVR